MLPDARGNLDFHCPHAAQYEKSWFYICRGISILSLSLAQEEYYVGIFREETSPMCKRAGYTFVIPCDLFINYDFPDDIALFLRGKDCLTVLFYTSISCNENTC